jgi:hypothetical protein
MKQSNSPSFIQLIAKRCSIVFFVVITASAMAQTRGTVTESKDPRIDTLLAKRLELSKLPHNDQATAQVSSNGFRVQIFMGISRTDAYNAMARFNDLYPDIKTYIIYTEPNFKVKVGDFKARLEATRLMEQLRSQFTSLFVLSEKINLQ